MLTSTEQQELETLEQMSSALNEDGSPKWEGLSKPPKNCYSDIRSALGHETMRQFHEGGNCGCKDKPRIPVSVAEALKWGVEQPEIKMLQKWGDGRWKISYRNKGEPYNKWTRPKKTLWLALAAAMREVE